MKETKHTRGEMRGEVGGPGGIGGRGLIKVGHLNRTVFTVPDVLGEEATENHANLRRLVAVWNACAGLSTEALESGALGEALEAVSDWLLDHGNDLGPDPMRLRAALAKLEARDDE